ncbi:MAG TPA: YqaA family protein [Rhodothermales bacterium]
MDLTTWVAEYGIWGVSLVAFLGATLVPVSSEIAVVAALKAGMVPWHVFVAASVGNAAGASLDYVLGHLFSRRVEVRLNSNSGGRRALRWSQKYGRWSLLGSWLPVVGDPLCLAAGLFRVSFPFFVAVGLGTRIVRYVILVLLLQPGPVVLPW